MNVSLVACLARPARYASSRSVLLPVRSVTRLQRSRPLQHTSPLTWTLGASRSFSWNPFGGTNVQTTAPETQAPLKSLAVDQNVTAAAELPTQPSESPALIATDVSSSIGAAASETLSDTISDTISDATVTLASYPIPTQYGDMAALGLVSWTPAGVFPWLLEVVQVSTSLPWWGTIVLTTVGLRAVLLPLILRSNRTQARLAPLQPKLTELRNRANKAKAEGDIFGARQAMQENMTILKKNNINPLDSLLTAVAQAAAQIGFFIGLRRMCSVPVEQLKVGGFGWITDLTVADPFYILPLVNFALINLQLSLSRRDMLAVGTATTPHILNGLRVFSAISFPLIMYFPAAINLHLISSIAFISLQTLLLRRPAIRTTLSLPPLPPVPKTKPPGLKDSLLLLKDWYKRHVEEARRKEAERQRKIRMVQKQRSR